MAEQGAQCVRALIVDDEAFSRRVLRSLLSADRDIQIVAEAASAPEARRKIMELQPDIVFMDIEIPEGSGIELLRGLEMQPCIVFVTAHPEHALAAFELRAVDYLVKPVERRRLAESLVLAKRRIGERQVALFARKLADAATLVNAGSVEVGAPAAGQYPDQLTIHVRRRAFTLDVGDIYWVEGAGQYSRLYTRAGEFLLSRTLGSLEFELDPDRFFRIHRSAIVNGAYVSEVRSVGDGRYNVYLRGGKALPLGRARRAVLEKLGNGIATRRN